MVAVPVDLLRELGVEADERGLLDELRTRVTASMIQKIAEADYGSQARQHGAALEQIVRTGAVPKQLRWVPGEVLELIRWSEPDDPKWAPSGREREGHVMRAFACTVLLVVGGLEEDHAREAGENQTVIQLVASVLELGGDLVGPTQNLLFGRLTRRSIDVEESVFFILGLLILLRLGGQRAPTPDQWNVLAKWLDDAELEARRASLWPDSGHWLIDVSSYDIEVKKWKALARRAFESDGPAGAELIAERMSDWPA
jgi:hypothetical protein